MCEIGKVQRIVTVIPENMDAPAPYEPPAREQVEEREPVTVNVERKRERQEG